MSSKFIFAAILLMLAGSTYADVSAGSYVGIGLGQNNFTSDALTTSKISSDKSRSAQKLYLGYRFNRNWGVEAGYANLGRIKNTYAAGTFNGEVRSVYLAGIGRLPLTEKFALTGKVMMVSSRTKASSDSSNAAELASLKGRKRNFVLPSIGVEYAFTPAMSASVDLDQFGKVSDKLKASMLSMNLKYHF